MSLCRRFASLADGIGFLSRRGVTFDSEVAMIVADIIKKVQAHGDAAVLHYAQRFDSPEVGSVLATEEEIGSATVNERALAAIRTAIRRVREFHEAQLNVLTEGWEHESRTWRWTKPEIHGGAIGQRMRPLRSAGIYVPGGTANYPSSVIMNCIPARCAGVEQLAITSPAGSNGRHSDAVLVAARECGISTIAKVGGAAAVAALAFGTESIPRVAKIAGPGNKYVNEAKRQLWGLVGLDLYAGPSEVCVLLDDSSNAEFAAADWLTQVEHAEDNAGFLVSLSESKLKKVMAAAERQLTGAPREEVLRTALKDKGAAFLARTLTEAVDVVNAIAPEHLTLAVREPEAVAERIHNAGCLLLGEYAPESAGDYAIGPSHTLPTATAARFSSPLNVLDFLKLQSVSRLTPEDMADLAETVETFGEIEGLPAHAYGASVRAKER